MRRLYPTSPHGSFHGPSVTFWLVAFRKARNPVTYVTCHLRLTPIDAGRQMRSRCVTLITASTYYRGQCVPRHALAGCWIEVITGIVVRRLPEPGDADISEDCCLTFESRHSTRWAWLEGHRRARGIRHQPVPRTARSKSAAHPDRLSSSTRGSQRSAAIRKRNEAHG